MGINKGEVVHSKIVVPSPKGHRGGCARNTEKGEETKETGIPFSFQIACVVQDAQSSSVALKNSKQNLQTELICNAHRG